MAMVHAASDIRLWNVNGWSNVGVRSWSNVVYTTHSKAVCHVTLGNTHFCVCYILTLGSVH